MNPIIGILGGMGPRATVQFEQLLMKRFLDSDQAIPTIISINDGSIPDRSRFLMGNGPDPLPKMLKNALAIEDIGASFIAIPCNTACVNKIFNRLQDCVSIPILNLPEIVVNRLSEQNIRSTYLLGTQGTIESDTYQTLCNSVGILCVVPDKGTQRIVDSVIKSVKSGSLENAKLSAQMIRQNITRSNVETVVLGCTELSLLTDSLIPFNTLGIDTLKLLVDECIAYTEKLKLKGVERGTVNV